MFNKSKFFIYNKKIFSYLFYIFNFALRLQTSILWDMGHFNLNGVHQHTFLLTAPTEILVCYRLYYDDGILSSSLNRQVNYFLFKIGYFFSFNSSCWQIDIVISVRPHLDFLRTYVNILLFSVDIFFCYEQHMTNFAYVLVLNIM